jgi:hypothetical protein
MFNKKQKMYIETKKRNREIELFNDDVVLFGDWNKGFAIAE